MNRDRWAAIVVGFGFVLVAYGAMVALDIASRGLRVYAMGWGL